MTDVQLYAVNYIPLKSLEPITFKMTVLIIEDEAPAARRLQKLLEEINPQISIIAVLGGVNESIEWLQSNTCPDIIFMDIQLNDGISFEIFDQVNIPHPIIFTTAFDDYVLNAFKVNSIDYLLKPINEEELKRSLDKYENLKSQFTTSDHSLIKSLVSQVQQQDKQYKTRFLVKKGEQLLSINTADILSFQSRNGLVYILTAGNKKYLIDQTLDDLAQILDSQKYFRVNRQFILSYESIQIVHKYGKGKLLVETTFNCDEQIIISAEKASIFKTWFG